MKLQTTINLIRYSSLFMFLSLFPLAAVIYIWAKEGQLLALELGLGGFAVLFFVVRRFAITSAIRRSRYPGVLYAVLEKLKQTAKLELTLTDEMLEDRYNPSYPTEQFLKDNQLSADLHLIEKTGQYQVSFRKEGFFFWGGQPILWQQLYDWETDYHGAAPNIRRMLLYYNDEKGNGLVKAIPLDMIKLSNIDALLLLTHFKGRYGNTGTNTQTALPD